MSHLLSATWFHGQVVMLNLMAIHAQFCVLLKSLEQKYD